MYVLLCLDASFTLDYGIIAFITPVGIVYWNAEGNFLNLICSFEQGMMLDFAKNLSEFVASSKKKHVVLLSSLDFGKWQRVDMSRYTLLMLLYFVLC